MSKETNYNKVSSIFFFSGFLLSKIQYVPFIIASSFTNLAALVLYMMGYGLWFIGIQGTPPNPEWSPFANLKSKFLYAAVLGLLASTISVLALINPLFLVPAAWLYFASNVLWVGGEYYKLQGSDPNSTREYINSQKNYFNYSITISTIGFVTALATTLSFFIPPITLPVILISSIICIGLGCLSFEYWLESKITSPSTTDIELVEISHNKIQSELGASNRCKKSDEQSPYHGNSPLRNDENPDENYTSSLSSESDLGPCHKP
ncbi:hypothetical protein [Legionella waltersii]|uniref:Transmembrane protein n=1 Tax=Legionella waltersii TaxID=66969 RepID=A0A0W1ALR2_9GAMM|nr:hypothetical protein [Legionella waltersii]KTD82260.1 hypothetical protein Lwal_0737 [Legionella waltersii]SNV04423.1 Uncharacterised protein [Legionella waltersii]